MQSTFLRLAHSGQPFRVRSRLRGNVYYVDPAQLLGNPQPCYINTVEQQNGLIAFLVSHGWLTPLINNAVTGELVDGKGRALVAMSLGLDKVPVQDVYLSRDEQRSAALYLNALGKLAQFEKSTTDETLRDIASSSKKQRLLLTEMARYDVIPSTGTRLRTRTEQRDAPIEVQDFVKRQCRKGDKEVWALAGETRVFGTPSECKALVEIWEKTTGLKAVRLTPGQLTLPESLPEAA